MILVFKYISSILFLFFIFFYSLLAFGYVFFTLVHLFSNSLRTSDSAKPCKREPFVLGCSYIYLKLLAEVRDE